MSELSYEPEEVDPIGPRDIPGADKHYQELLAKSQPKLPPPPEELQPE